MRRLEARPDLTELNAALAEEITDLLGEPPTLDLAHAPAVILVVGVNGDRQDDDDRQARAPSSASTAMT